MKAAREAWFAAQPDLDPDKLVFLDETAAATNMARRYGRAPCGERCRLLVPQGHYKTTTVTAAMRTTGLCAFDIADGATNGQRFRDYAANRLVPVLRPGDFVILDNLQAVWLRNVVGMWPVGQSKPTLGSSKVRTAALPGGPVDARHPSPGPHHSGCPRRDRLLARELRGAGQALRRLHRDHPQMAHTRPRGLSGSLGSAA